MSELTGVENIWTKGEIKKQLYVCFLGIFFSFSAFRAVIDLQTSINIQDGIGSTSGFVVGGTTIISCLTITPPLLNYLGPRKSLILCEIFYLFFVFANFYPVLGTMIPASMLSGAAEALVFPSLSVITFYYALHCSKISRGKSVQHYVHEFAGKCFGTVYLTRVSGNLISYLVMYITKISMPAVGNSSLTVNESSGEKTLEYCGANDCQDPNITEQNLSSYVAQKSTIYILLSIFVVLMIISMIIHYFGLEEIHPLSASDVNDNVLELLEDHDRKDSAQAEEESSTTLENGKCQNSVMFSTLMKCLLQMKNPKQLLISCIQLYAGLHLAFMIAEFSRAYLSCMVGVEHVGLAVAVYGTAGCASSYLNGILAGRIGRNIPLFSVFLLDVMIYLFCIFWTPEKSTVWMTFVIAGGLGYTSGVWQSLTNAMCAKYFKRNQEVAFSIWGMFFSSGIAIQFGWSRYICVRTKLYIMLIFLCIAMTLYGVAEFKYQRKSKTDSVKSKRETLIVPS